MRKFKNLQAPRWLTVAICIFLFIGTIWNIGSVVFQQQGKYFSHTYWQRYPQFKQTYLDSQYVNKHPKGFIPDETVYAYSGGAFILGANPLLIVPDAPPLGKYFIGLSIAAFNNENDIILFFVLVSFFLLFFLGKQILSSTLLSLIPVFLYSSELLCKNQLVFTPLFDVMQLAFLLAIFLLFNKGFMAKKEFALYFVVTCFLLGCFVSIKFFASGITVLIAWYVVLLAHREKEKLLTLTLFTPLIPIVLLLSYARVFAYGYTLKKLIGAQKWIFIYHQGQLIKPFSIWPLLLANKWYVWWGNIPVLSDSQWTVMWPIITVISFVTIGLYLKKFIPKKPEVEVLMVWVVCYLLFFSVGQITVRYFVILLPILYIISVFGVTNVLNKYLVHKL